MFQGVAVPNFIKIVLVVADQSFKDRVPLRCVHGNTNQLEIAIDLLYIWRLFNTPPPVILMVWPPILCIIFKLCPKSTNLGPFEHTFNRELFLHSLLKPKCAFCNSELGLRKWVLDGQTGPRKKLVPQTSWCTHGIWPAITQLQHLSYVLASLEHSWPLPVLCACWETKS